MEIKGGKMKKGITMVVLTLFALPAVVFAVSNNANQATTTKSVNAVSNQVQAQTNNQGEESQIQTQTKTEEQIQAQTEQDIEASKQKYEVKNETAGSRSSEVAKAVQGMLTVANRVNDQGIGDQIRNIAKEQNQAEDDANKAMDKIQSRTGFAEFFIGPNYKQIKEVKKVMEQNQLRIQELQQIMTKLSNESDKTEIQNQINVLELQNLNLANQLDAEDEGFTLLGWFIRLFYGI